jgi:hypothetical protein
MKKIIIIVVIVLAVLGLGALLLSQDVKTSQPEARNNSVSNDLAHVPVGSALISNMKKAGLDVLNSEGTALHIHQHLDIVINGKAVAVPAEIGVGNSFISPLHTHDATGIIHVESPVKKDFTLGQFFTEWNIEFSASHLGGYVADQNNKLVAAVNGVEINNPQDYVLKAHDEIEIWYGQKNINPDLIKSFNFPEGL